MIEEQMSWVQTRMQWLDKQVHSYPEKLRPIVQASYVQNLLLKLPLLPGVQADFAHFQAKIETLLATLPSAEDVKASSFSSYTKYTKALGALKKDIKESYNLVAKGYYKRICLPVGIAIGVSYDTIMNNLALGLCLGLAIGLSIGAGLDSKAEKENRVL